MTEEERLGQVIYLLREHSARPALKFPSEAEIPKIARKILEAAMGPKTLWTKWGAERDEIATRAADLWVPIADLMEALNLLPGERLTVVDVEQRLYALRNRYGGYSTGPDEELREPSFEAFKEEKAKGTEFIAILGWLEEWTWGAQERLRRRQEKERRERIEQDKSRAEARLRSGADCPWTAVAGIPDLHCRKNGRLFRLKALEKADTPLAPRFEVLEVKGLEEKDRRGITVGQYRTRSDASKAVLEVAYRRSGRAWDRGPANAWMQKHPIKQHKTNLVELRKAYVLALVLTREIDLPQCPGDARACQAYGGEPYLARKTPFSSIGCKPFWFPSLAGRYM